MKLVPQAQRMTYDDVQIAFQRRLAPLHAGDGIQWLGGVMRLLVWRKTKWPLAFASHHQWDKRELLDVFQGKVNDHRTFERLAGALRISMNQVFEVYDVLVQTYGTLPPDAYEELSKLCDPGGADKETYTKLVLSRRLERELLETPPRAHKHPLFFVTLAEACGKTQECEDLARSLTAHQLIEGTLRPIFETQFHGFEVALEVELESGRARCQISPSPPADRLLEVVSFFLQHHDMTLVSCRTSSEEATLEFDVVSMFHKRTSLPRGNVISL